ncbi:hypothetical protein D3C75_740620 [compost metagenome]
MQQGRRLQSRGAFQQFGAVGSVNGYGQEEGAACVERASDRNGASHQGRQLLGNGQTQARPAELAAGVAFHLTESLEYAGLIFLRDADSRIRNLKAQGKGLFLVNVYPQGDGTGFGEFQSIGQEVPQDLEQPLLVQVYLHRPQILFHQQVEGEALALHHRQELVLELIDGLMKIESFLQKRHLAGFNFGQVQNIVNQVQQLVA